MVPGHVESSFVNPSEKFLSKSSSFSGSISEFETFSKFFIEKEFAKNGSWDK